MKFIKGSGKRLASIPIPATLFVLGLGLFIWGAYVVTPWYVPAAPVSLAFDTRWTEVALGLLYMGLGGIRVAGSLTKNKTLMLMAPYGLMMGYLFLAILRIAVVGWIPFTWLPLVVCALISGICRLALLYGPEDVRD